MAEKNKVETKAEATTTYIARHRIIRTEEGGVRREYVAGQPIKLTAEDAKKMIEKKAVFADQQEAADYAKAKVEGPTPQQSPTTDADAEDAKHAAEAEERVKADAEQRNEETEATEATEGRRPIRGNRSVV